MEKLSQEQIDAKLGDLADWSQLNESLTRTYQFDDFEASMAFVNRVAQAAEEADHHPDILIRWNKVSLTLSTHDAGGITEKDFDLATRCDNLAAAAPNAT